MGRGADEPVALDAPAKLRSVVQAGGQPTSCEPAKKDNTYFSPALRMEFDLVNDMTLTTLSTAQSFSRRQAIDG